MLKIKLKMLKAFVFGKKDLNLKVTNADKIEEAREKVNSALKLFQDLKSELVYVNQDLISLIKDAETELKKISQEIESANTELTANVALIERFEEFLK